MTMIALEVLAFHGKMAMDRISVYLVFCSSLICIEVNQTVSNNGYEHLISTTSA